HTKLAMSVGLAVVVIYVFGFGVWGATAPIAGAVMAEGTVVARGQNKTIQHLEGGIVRAITVKEGDRVRLGDTLMEFEPTLSESSLRKLTEENDIFLGREARLAAERSGASEVVFPDSLLKRMDDPKIARLINDQQSEFA